MKLPELRIGNLVAKVPIIQGGMAIRLSTARLAAAVANEGGIGLIAASGLPFDELRYEIQLARKLSPTGIIGINAMVAATQFAGLVKTAIEEGIDLVVAGAGFSRDMFAMGKESGTPIVPIVSSAKLARISEGLGAAAVIVEGCEAGGHLGTDRSAREIVPEVVAAVKNIPVIAAGGIADGRGMAAAFALGAKAVQMGTRFVLSEECIAHENYKNAVLKAKDRATVMTGLTTGHPVRIIDNALAHKYKSLEFSGGSKEDLENLGAGTLRKAAIEGDVKEGSVMIGQISGMLTDIKPCATIIKDIMAETETVIKNLQGLVK